MGSIKGATLPNKLLNVFRGFSTGEESEPPPISISGVDNLRRLLLRTLNDNQLLILNKVASNSQPLTGLLNKLSQETGIPLSTLKLNARILRKFNLISYGSVRERRLAEVEPVGALVLRLMEADEKLK
jgi:predicted transcriptional regulator